MVDDTFRVFQLIVAVQLIGLAVFTKFNSRRYPCGKEETWSDFHNQSKGISFPYPSFVCTGLGGSVSSPYAAVMKNCGNAEEIFKTSELEEQSLFANEYGVVEGLLSPEQLSFKSIVREVDKFYVDYVFCYIAPTVAFELLQMHHRVSSRVNAGNNDHKADIDKALWGILAEVKKNVNCTSTISSPGIDLAETLSAFFQSYRDMYDEPVSLLGSETMLSSAVAWQICLPCTEIVLSSSSEGDSLETQAILPRDILEATKGSVVESPIYTGIIYSVSVDVRNAQSQSVMEDAILLPWKCTVRLLNSEDEVQIVHDQGDANERTLISFQIPESAIGIAPSSTSSEEGVHVIIKLTLFGVSSHYVLAVRNDHKPSKQSTKDCSQSVGGEDITEKKMSSETFVTDSVNVGAIEIQRTIEVRVTDVRDVFVGKEEGYIDVEHHVNDKVMNFTNFQSEGENNPPIGDTSSCITNEISTDSTVRWHASNS